MLKIGKYYDNVKQKGSIFFSFFQKQWLHYSLDGQFPIQFISTEEKLKN